MLKSLALKYWPFALNVIFVVAILGMSRYAVDGHQDHQKDGNLVIKPSTSVTPSDGGKGSEKAEESEHPPSWIETFTWPEGVTAWALLFTLLVITWQSTETRAAAQSAERQIALQSVAMRQWVNIEPIKTVTSPNFIDSSEIALQFEVRNRTDYLITIKKIVAEVVHGAGPTRSFTVSCSVPVPPEKSSVDGGHPFYVNAFADRSTWTEIGAIFIVSGQVTYADCMDIERTQEFGDLFRGFGDGRLLKMKPSGLAPEVADYKAEG